MRNTAHMPRTRQDQEREAKVAEIVESAAGRLRSGGYDDLSVAGIARELALSPNSIYWYFPSKDELFVAAVRHILAGILAAKPARRRSLETRVLWFVEQIDDVDHLRRALYDRARQSVAVAEFVRELEHARRQMLVNALAGEVPEAELEIAADALLATIEGATLRDLGTRGRRRVVAYTLSRFTADGRRDRI